MMEQWKAGSRTRLDMRGVPAAAQVIANQVLGDGEVSIRVTGNRLLKIQESVFADSARGRARQRGPVARRLARGRATAGRSARRRPRQRARQPDASRDCGRRDEFAALLHELQAQLKSYKPGDKPHVLNLTLFPMTPEDHQVLERALPVGSVAIISRGSATAASRRPPPATSGGCSTSTA